MKILNKFGDDYFLKYRETPVKLKEYDPRQQLIADKYTKRLNRLLKDVSAKISVRGSTLFKIYSKGEVEIGIYTNEENWKIVSKILTSEFGQPEVVESNYLRFNSLYTEHDREVELIVLKGYEALVDIKLHEYLLNHPDLLVEYVAVKKKSCFSKREYQIQKDKFLNKVIEMITEE